MFITVIAGYNYKVNTEAEELQERFGVQWFEYCKKTGKYFSKINI